MISLGVSAVKRLLTNFTGEMRRTQRKRREKLKVHH
jgi:hypothetical protein